MPTLYFAYGSNLDPQGMAARCPRAVPVIKATLADWRLTFRGVADVEPSPGDRVEGYLWACSKACIRSLDRYEGVGGGFYRKERLIVDTEHGPAEALVYVMNHDERDNRSMPSAGYLATIVRGYNHFALDKTYVNDALDRSWHRVTNGTGRATMVENGPKRLMALAEDRVTPKRQRPRRSADDGPGAVAPSEQMMRDLEARLAAARGDAERVA